MKRITVIGGLVVFAAMFSFCFAEAADEVELKEAALKSLREADKSWAQSAPDLEVFMSFIADDVVWFFCNRPPMTGKSQVRSHYEKVFAMPDFSLTWTPARIDVSATGDMGYASGTWTAFFLDSSGEVKQKGGPYATVWKKRSSGEWEVVLEADYVSGK
jgi:ketosteroid isomerase-like protein